MKKIEIPRLEQHNDKLPGLVKQHAELGARLVALERRRAEYARENPDNSFGSPRAENQRVAELLGTPPGEIIPDRREVLAQMAQDARDLRTAVGLLEQQIAFEKRKARAVILPIVEPAYREKVRALLQALRNAHDAQIAVQKHKDDLRDADIFGGALEFGTPSFLGSPTDSSSPVAYYFRDAVDGRFLPAKDAPEGLQYK